MIPAPKKRTAALLIGAFFLAVFFPFPIGKNEPHIQRLSDLAHLPLFAAVYFGLFTAFSYRHSFLASLSRAIALSFLIVVLVEIVQPLFGRSKSEMDILYGVLGIAVTSAAHICWTRLRSPVPGLALALCFTLLLPLLLRPTWFAYQAAKWRTAAFPQLGNFETPLELILWQPTGEIDPEIFFVTTEWHSLGTHSLKVQTGNSPYSGVVYQTGDVSWAPYQQLSFDVYSPQESFELQLRIDDDGDCRDFESRYNSAVSLTPGHNSVIISMNAVRHGPKNRELDLHHIRRVLMFTGKEPIGRTFFIDNVRLE